MPQVDFDAHVSIFRTPKAAFQNRLRAFSEEEIAEMTVKDFEALAFDLRSPMGGAGFTDLYEQKLLDHAFTDPAWSPPSTLYIGMSSTTPTEAAGSITEPSTGGYARLATTAADWSAASGTAPAVKTNTATFTYALASASWVAGANITTALLCATLSGTTTADYIAWGPVGTAKPVISGDTANFPPGSIVFQMGDPGDTY